MCIIVAFVPMLQMYDAGVVAFVIAKALYKMCDESCRIIKPAKTKLLLCTKHQSLGCRPTFWQQAV